VAQLLFHQHRQVFVRTLKFPKGKGEILQVVINKTFYFPSPAVSMALRVNQIQSLDLFQIFTGLIVHASYYSAIQFNEVNMSETSWLF